MRTGIRIAAICLASIVVVSCGGNGGSADSTVAEETSTSAAPGTETSAPPTTQPTGGGSAAGVCELVTSEELAGIFGVPAVTTTVIAGPPDNCIVESDAGDPLGAWSLTTAQASSVFDAFTSDPSTVEVSGIGDEAAIVQNTGLLVLKGDNLVVISISGGADMSEEEAIDASKAIGAFAAGRL